MGFLAHIFKLVVAPIIAVTAFFSIHHQANQVPAAPIVAASSTQIIQQSVSTSSTPKVVHAPKIKEQTQVSTPAQNGPKTLAPQAVSQAPQNEVQQPDLSNVEGSSLPATTTTSRQSGLSPAAFVQVLENVERSNLEDDPYLKEKAILLRGLLNGPLSQADIAQLSPDVASIYQGGNVDAIELQIQALNEQALNYEVKIKQTYQTEINDYSLQNGLPITQLPPAETTCTWVGFGMVNCVTQ
jgi:hypothetical protein